MPLKFGYVTDERYPSQHTDCLQVIKTIDALGAEGCEVDLIHPRLASSLLSSPQVRKKNICDYYNVEGHFRDRDLLLWPGSDLRVEKFYHGLAGPLLARTRSYDLIHTRNILPLAISVRLEQPVLFETYKPLPVSDPLVWRVVKQALKYPCFLGLAVHSDFTRDVMIEHGVDPERVRVIRNGFDPADFLGPVDRGEARRSLGLPLDARLAVYTGQIRPDKGIFSLLELAEDRPDWTVLMVGGFPRDVEFLAGEARSRGLDNVMIHGQVPVSEVSAYLAAADVLMLPLSSMGLLKSGRSTVLPMKIFSYLAAGKPIVAPDLPDTVQVLIHNHNSLRVAPDDRHAAAAALGELARDPSLGVRLGTQALEDSRQYTWRARARRIIDFVEERFEHLRNNGCINR